MGMRCYYICIPVTMWLLGEHLGVKKSLNSILKKTTGPWWLIVGTILLIISLYLLDHGYA